MSGADPLWRQCAAWLDRFNLIPPQHPSLSHRSKPHHLLVLLRNGVILCQTVHALDPNCIDLTKVIYAPPGSDSVEDFVCRNNIFLFLRAVVTEFELDPEQFFFDPTCLYQYQDVGKVFRTLSAVSWSEKASKFNIPGFPKKERKLEKRLESEEELYEDLRKQYDLGESELGSAQQTDSTGDYEDIYQSVISPSKPKRSISLISHKRNKREFPIKEFLDTEENYLVNLVMVRDSFRDRISQLSEDKKDLVFNQLDNMIRLHQTILGELKQTKNDIGKVLMKNFDGFSIYREYCVNLGRSQALLQGEELRNPLLKEELLQCRLAVKSPFPLSGHIVIPFQRLLKYHLMLESILKYTDENHPQYTNLHLSKEAFIELNYEINELKRDAEEDEAQEAQDLKDQGILEKVESSIKSMNLPNKSRLVDYGRMLRAGDLAVYGHQGEADYAFLLQTVIIFCNKPRLLQHRFRFKFAVKLKDYDVVDGGDHIRLVNNLNLIHPLMLTCKLKQEVRFWYKDLELCKNLITPRDNRGHSLVLCSLAGQICGRCDRKLIGIIGQGYRCRTCEMTMHTNCLTGSCCSGSEDPDVEFRRSGSIVLPTLGDRGSLGSTLSLAHVTRDNSQVVQQLQEEWAQEMVSVPLEYQAWYAGNLDMSTAKERMKSLPHGTFLVRKIGAAQDYALDVQTKDGVKHLKIFCMLDDRNEERFSFSAARSFQSVVDLINYYRKNDLLENFSYKHMVGVKLKLPYKNA